MEGLDQNITDILALTVTVGALVAGFGKFFGPYQMELSQAVIDAGEIPTRYKRLINIGVGLVLAVGFMVGAAYILDLWPLVWIGFLAGLLSSVEASRTHEAKTTVNVPLEPPATTDA